MVAFFYYIIIQEINFREDNYNQNIRNICHNHIYPGLPNNNLLIDLFNESHRCVELLNNKSCYFQFVDSHYFFVEIL